MARGKHKKGRRRRGTPGPRIEAELEAVEFARGHDGFLRGKPEPVLMFAAFVVGGGRVSLLERGLRRLTVSEPYPSVAEVTRVAERELFTAPVPSGWDRILVLGIAVEEDDGRDVEALYAGLADPEALSSWTLEARVPDPLTVDEIGEGELSVPPEGVTAQLLSGGVHLAEKCGADDWVGGAYVVLETGRHQSNLWRLRFVSADGRNDWTAKLRVKLSG